MKRTFILLFAMLTISLQALGQVTLSQQEIDNLPPDMKERISQIKGKKENVEKLQEVSEYAGLGKEIGEAVNGALSAVKDNAIEIAESHPGKVAIAVAVWKLLWKDIVGIIVGLILLCIMIWRICTLTNKLHTGALEKIDSDCAMLSITCDWIGVCIFFISVMFCIFH